MWPLAVAGLGLRYFATPMAVRLVHPLRYLQQMVFKSVEILGLQKDWCENWMLLALFCTVCMQNAMFWELCAWVLAQSGVANRVMALWLWWAVVRRVPRWRVHRSVIWSLLPIKIMFPLYLTIQVVLVKVTSHSTSGRHWIWGAKWKWGGIIRLPPPNRFARLKIFSCNCRFEKPQTLFLEKSLVLGWKWFFFGGESIEGAQKMVLAQFHAFLQYQKWEAKYLNRESNACPNSSAFLTVGNH